MPWSEKEKEAEEKRERDFLLAMSKEVRKAVKKEMKPTKMKFGKLEERGGRLVEKSGDVVGVVEGVKEELKEVRGEMVRFKGVQAAVNPEHGAIFIDD